MVGITQQEQYSNLRFQNYATARFIGFTCGSFDRITHYLLGMTIELSYKQLCSTLITESSLFTNNEKKIIYRSHDLIQLHQLCQDKGLLSKITGYEEFLNYANIFYKTRYPSHAKEAEKKASEAYPFMSHSINNYFPFDDFICQLDDEIFERTLDHTNSIIWRAITHLNSYQPKALFHCNSFAFRRIDNYIGFLDLNYSTHAESLVCLQNNRNSLLTRGVSGHISTSIENSENLTFKNFPLSLASVRL